MIARRRAAPEGAWMQVMALALVLAGAGCGDDAADAAPGSTGGTGDADAGDDDGDSDGEADAGAGAGAGDGDGDGDGDGEADAVAGDPSRLVGTFTVTLVEGEGDRSSLSNMRGFVRDAPVHPLVLWVSADQVGDCALETPDFPFCDPDCASGSGCVEDDVCAPDPVAIDVGTVTVSGLQTAAGNGDFELTQVGPSYAPDAAIDLEYPPAAEGSEVRIATGGGELAPFEVITYGIAPLVVEPEMEQPLPLTPGDPLRLRWQPAGVSSRSSITVVVDVSHHGGSRGRVVCTADDGSGALDVDASLVTQLIELGTAGFPTVKLYRRAVGSTTIAPGRVDLILEHSRELKLQIPGVISCDAETPCPDGQSCQAERKCG